MWSGHETKGVHVGTKEGKWEGENDEYRELKNELSDKVLLTIFVLLLSPQNLSYFVPTGSDECLDSAWNIDCSAPS
jgi:hypothetical protein